MGLAEREGGVLRHCLDSKCVVLRVDGSEYRLGLSDVVLLRRLLTKPLHQEIRAYLQYLYEMGCQDKLRA